MTKNWHFCEIFSLYPILDHHKIETRANFENPNGNSLDLHLIMWFIIKKLNCYQVKQILQWPFSKYPQNRNIFRLCKSLIRFHMKTFGKWRVLITTMERRKNIRYCEKSVSFFEKHMVNNYSSNFNKCFGFTLKKPTVSLADSEKSNLQVGSSCPRFIALCLVATFILSKALFEDAVFIYLYGLHERVQ